MSKPVLAFTP